MMQGGGLRHDGFGVGRQGRRLTPAPSIRRALLPSEVPIEKEDEEDVRRRVAQGHEELSEMVATIVPATQGPKLVHAVQDRDSIDQLGPIQTKFWNCSDDQVISEDDEDLSMTEFIHRAKEVRFTVDDLLRADKALASGMDPCLANIKLTHTILSTMVNRKVSGGVPWQGPLPSPRISPPRTLGDCLAKASYQNSPRSSSAKLIAGAKIVNSLLPEGGKPASVLKNSKVFESMDKETATEFPPLFPESTTTPLVCGRRYFRGLKHVKIRKFKKFWKPGFTGNQSYFLSAP